MLYIKKIVDQDIKKELAFQFGPSADFFRMDCNDTYAVKHDLSLVFETESDSLKFFNNHKINTVIHYNSNKRECRVTSEVKSFIFDANKCNAKAGDLIVLKRSETTASEYQKACNFIKFDVVKRGSDSFDFYQRILDTNIYSQRGFCCVTTDVELPESTEELHELSDTEKSEDSDKDLNVIFYGAPGTGKSTAADSILQKGGFRTFRTTFHPESDYYSFVGSYKPSSNNGKIDYFFVPQIFMKAYLYAWTHPDTKTCLNIEEINRGNCAQIFGDIFQLLDRKLPEGCSKYPIDIDADCAAYIEKYFNDLGSFQKLDFYKEQLCRYTGVSQNEFSFEKILLPGKLYIFATMNTSDQSLYPMDSAFKRRWSWKYVPIDYSKVENIYVRISDSRYSWSEFLKCVNSRIIQITQSEDKQLGQFFIPVDRGDIKETEFRDKVLFYLWNDIYKDEYGTSSTIFRIPGDDGNNEQVTFSSLFDDGASDRLKGIMKTLGILPLKDVTETAEQIQSIQTTSDIHEQMQPEFGGQNHESAEQENQ